MTTDSIDRGPEMILIAFFCARFGEPAGNGLYSPPKELGARTWTSAYRLFWHELVSSCRDFKRFYNSINKDRLHFIDCISRGLIDNPYSTYRIKLLTPWANATRADFWAEVQKFKAVQTVSQ